MNCEIKFLKLLGVSSFNTWMGLQIQRYEFSSYKEHPPQESPWFLHNIDPFQFKHSSSVLYRGNLNLLARGRQNIMDHLGFILYSGTNTRLTDLHWSRRCELCAYEETWQQPIWKPPLCSGTALGVDNQLCERLLNTCSTKKTKSLFHAQQIKEI